MEIERQKQAISLIMPVFLDLLTSNHCLEDLFLTNCTPNLLLLIFDALRDLVAFVQFKKPEKYPWRSVNFSKVAG